MIFMNVMISVLSLMMTGFGGGDNEEEGRINDRNFMTDKINLSVNYILFYLHCTLLSPVLS
jgi:hypothetical protein